VTHASPARRTRGSAYRLAAAICIVSLAACSKSDSTSTAPVDTTDRLALFDRVHADVESRFSYFDRANVDWTAIRSAYRDSVMAAANRVAAEQFIGRMVGRLKDYHAGLATPSAIYGPPPIPFPNHFNRTVIDSRYLTSAQLSRSGRLRFGRVDTDVGYVQIATFTGTNWGTDIDDVLASLGAIRGLIIDIRDNGGGDEAIARIIASRFYDRTRAYRTTRFRDPASRSSFNAPISVTLDAAAAPQRFAGPVVLITNRFNGSSAEDFVCMMRALPQVATLGDTTIGNGSNPLLIDYGNGYALRVPQSQQATPDGFVYQYVGLPPRIAVRWAVADSAGGRDPYLDAAITYLRSPP
jgi:carboxyl-terminal processing protease